MKKWAVVAWHHYYPSSGLGNIRQVFETEKEADNWVSDYCKKNEYGKFDEIQVVDLVEFMENFNNPQDSY